MRPSPVRRSFALVALAACLSACPAPVGPGAAPGAATGPKAKASKVPVAARPSAEASPAGDPPPAGDPSPAASAAPAATAPPAQLLKPATPVRTLAGVVRIDAAYAVAQAGARLVSTNGASAVNVAGQLMSNNAGNLIANNGGALLSDKGAGLVANNGGALTAKTKYGVRQAEAPAAGASPPAVGTSPPTVGTSPPADGTSPPAVGTILPAAGLLLEARSLRTGEPVSVGVDPEGRPVTTVLTNALGAFEVYVPEGEDKLVFEARFLGEAAKDPRLAYDLLPTGAQAALVIDEDTAQVTRYVRTAARGTIAKFVLSQDVATTVKGIAKDAAPELIAPLTALVTEFRALSAEVGLDKAPASEVTRVADRMTGAMLAHIDLEAVKLTKAYAPDWTGPEEPAIPALIDIMRDFREATTTKLASDPAYFDQRPYLLEANRDNPDGAGPWSIRKPADLNDYLLGAYVIPDRKIATLDVILADIGAPVSHSDRLLAAVNNYIGAIAMILFTDAAAKEESLAVLRAYRPGGTP